MNSPHLLRMLMVNSGKKGLIDIDFEQSLHFHGRNNAGKTTFVNALQFCFTDKFSSMVWDDHSQDETRKHYFPESSFIKFTVLTPFGIQNLLLVGYGPAKNHTFQRWIIQGDLEDSLLYSSTHDAILPSATVDVERELELHPGAKKVNESAMRQWIDGTGELPFTLIPLKRTGRFSDFRKLFNNLLRLNKLDSNEIKDLIIKCTSSIGAESINIRKDFSEAYEEYTSRRLKIQTIETNSRLLEQFLDDVNRLQETRSRYANLHSIVSTKISQYFTDLDGRIRELEDLLGGRNDELNRLKTQRDELRAVEEDQRSEIAKIELESKQNDEKISRAQGLSEIELTAQKSQFEQQLDAITTAIVDGTTSSKADLQSQILALEKEIRSIDNLLEGGTNLEMELSELFDEKTASLILKSLSKGLRKLESTHFSIHELPEQFGGFEIDTSSNTIRMGEVVVDLSTLPNLEVPKQKAELEEIKRRATQNLHRNQAALDALVRHEEKKQEKKKLRILLSQIDTDLQLIKQLPEFLHLAEGLHTKLLEIKDDLKATTTERSQIDDVLIDFQQQTNSYSKELELKRSALQRISERYKSLELPESDWAVKQTTIDDSDIGSLIEHLFSSADELTAINQRSQQKRYQVQEATNREFANSDIIAEAERVREELNSLPTLKTLLAKQESATQTTMKEKISAFLESLAAVRKMVNGISKQLRTIQISDIESFSLTWVDRQSNVGNAMKSLRTQTQLWDFEANDQVDNLVKLLFEQPELFLADFFDLRLAVSIDGKTREYDKIERIESKGTSLGILICIHVVLLKHMTKESRGRLPIFIDEVEKLDSININTIIEFCESNGFLVITASPRPSSNPRVQYLLDRSKFTNSSHRQDWSVSDEE